MSDQERISLNQKNTISNRQVMRIKKISAWGLLVDSIPNSQNKPRRNCIYSFFNSFNQYKLYKKRFLFVAT